MLWKITIHQCASQTYLFCDTPGKANSSGESCLVCLFLVFYKFKSMAVSSLGPVVRQKAETVGACGWCCLHFGEQGADSERLELCPKTQALFILTTSLMGSRVALKTSLWGFSEKMIWSGLAELGRPTLKCGRES